jgi:hypothetical protein
MAMQRRPGTLPKIAGDLLDDVRIYSDEEAFERDERRRPRPGFRLKPVHDRLFQLAIDLKLAERLCVLDWRRPPQLRAAFQIEVERASWWPGSENPNNKHDLLSVPLAPASEAALGRTWLSIRALAETRCCLPRYSPASFSRRFVTGGDWFLGLRDRLRARERWRKASSPEETRVSAGLSGWRAALRAPRASADPVSWSR